MELVKVENNQIVVAEEIMKQFKEFQVLKAQMEMKEKEIKEALLKAMQDNEVKSFENDFMKATYTAPTVRKTVDSDALKAQGLYESFLKESPVKASVRLTWK